MLTRSHSDFQRGIGKEVQICWNGKNKNIGQLFFHVKSLYEILKP